MYKTLLIICMTVAVALGHEDCKDEVWQNQAAFMGCCRSFNDSDFGEDEIAKVAQKCTKSDKDDECEIIKCVLKEEGAMTGDKINATAVVNLTLRGMGETLWKKVVSDSVNTCLERMKDKEHAYSYFLDCIDILMFTNCPKSEWTETTSCASYKKALAACL